MMFLLLPTFASAQATMHVIKEIKHDTSAPLSELVDLTPLQPNPFSPRALKVLPFGPRPEVPKFAVPDAALQAEALPPVSATLGLNFEGLGQGQYGFNLQFAPPDTNGVVGATQYVQWVNAEFAVFNKSTGAIIGTPHPGNAIWAGFGGVCQTTNDGDPIVQYDKIANRWIFTQFSIEAQPFTQCVAVSTTNDATGTYNRYAFQFGINFNDYPKLGVWPDGYYMTFNMFRNGQIFIGADACAMDRVKMLAGQTATIVCFQQSSAIGGMLPGDLDGTIQPAAGEPAFFLNFGTNSLRLWKFHVDFTTPANSTFTGPTTLAVSNFTPLGSVTQPGTTQKLDSLSDRLMYRLAYRKFADNHESLVVTHSITAGIRWYEIQDPNGTPTVFQQGTFAPDASTRWMGSVAMDQSGNIGLGYSVSSASVFPSVFFTGRVPGDPLGSMETEQLVVNGSGSQTGGLSRWGDYSAMTIDPADDCTFWYTQEYMKANGSFNWNTRIANFKFANCGGGGGGPVVSLSPTSLKWGKRLVGSPGTKTVTLTNTGNANLNITSLAISGDPDFTFKTVKKSCKNGGTVAPGAFCYIKVTFNPTQIGLRSGNVSITDDAADSPQSIPLQGTGK
jgi:centrosomal CEP192-like protein